MLDICLLGTGGMMPLPERHLTSLLARYNGNSILIDCGEGTQVAIKKAGFSVHPIGLICITHFHGDHLAGLPGLLLSIGNTERKETVTILGPVGVEKIVRSLCVIAPELPYKVNFVENKGDHGVFTYEYEGMEIEAFKVKHNILCYGYRIKVPRKGRFLPEKAKENEVPLKLWNRLQRGDVIEFEGRTYTQDLVMGEARRGLQVTYCTDTRPIETIAEMAKGSDLFICEGMYGGHEFDEKAKEKKHMTMIEACELGKKAEVSRMWLTHYSPAMTHPEWFIKEAKNVFDRVELGKDGKTVTLTFDEDEGGKDEKESKNE